MKRCDSFREKTIDESSGKTSALHSIQLLTTFPYQGDALAGMRAYFPYNVYFAIKSVDWLTHTRTQHINWKNRTMENTPKHMISIPMKIVGISTYSWFISSPCAGHKTVEYILTSCGCVPKHAVTFSTRSYELCVSNSFCCFSNSSWAK